MSKGKNGETQIAIVASEKARLLQCFHQQLLGLQSIGCSCENSACASLVVIISGYSLTIFIFSASQSRNCCGEESRWHSVMVEQLLLLEGGSASDFLSSLFFH